MRKTLAELLRSLGALCRLAISRRSGRLSLGPKQCSLPLTFLVHGPLAWANSGKSGLGLAGRIMLLATSLHMVVEFWVSSRRQSCQMSKQWSCRGVG